MVIFFIVIALVLANSDSCPLIIVQEAKANDVDTCLRSLATYSLSQEVQFNRSVVGFCRGNPNCDQVYSDFGQAEPSSSLFCIWRNCVTFCVLMNENPGDCINACLGLGTQCSNSQNVQEKIDCHVKLANEKTVVDKEDVHCPLLTTALDNFPDCLNQVHKMKMEVECGKLGSICHLARKFMDTDSCYHVARNPWYDLRLFCVATLCHRVCSRSSCVEECFGSCNKGTNEDSLQCLIQASHKYFSNHYVPVYVTKYYDRMKLEFCSSFNEVLGLEESDCIQVMMTVDFDEYCKDNEEVCQNFPDDCSQSKPRFVLHLRQGYVNADTTLICLGYKCSKVCQELGGNTNAVLKCRMECIGDIDKCSTSRSKTDIINCHIQESNMFRKENHYSTTVAKRDDSKVIDEKSQAVHQTQSYSAAVLSMLILWIIAH